MGNGRILITDDENNDDYVIFQLQELKRRFFWSNPIWITLSSKHAKYSYHKSKAIDWPVDEWKNENPDTPIVNNSTRYAGEMPLEKQPFKV